MPLKRGTGALRWCVLRHRRRNAKEHHSSHSSSRCASTSSPRSRKHSTEKITYPHQDAVPNSKGNEGEDLVDSSCCCCYAQGICSAYSPTSNPDETCYKDISTGMDNIQSTSHYQQSALCSQPSRSPMPPVDQYSRLQLTPNSLPASPVMPSIDVRTVQVQPEPTPHRKVFELAAQRANLMESSCSAGDIQAANTSLKAIEMNKDAKTKNRSLLELRRGPHAALVLNLHTGASSSPAPGRTPEDGSRLLLLTTEQPQLSYSTFTNSHDSTVSLNEAALCSTARQVVPWSSSQQWAACPPPPPPPPTHHPQQQPKHLTATANLSPRPKTGEEPSITADRVVLRTAALPLTVEALEAKLGAGEDDKLYKEFWDIPMNYTHKADCPWVGVGQKNRYHGILPHNSTRVVLPAINNDDMTSYINANYISGYQGRPKAFIATQGPMSHTVNDFWRMIWHTRSPAVVMLTKICEQDKRSKCELYLPTMRRDTSGCPRADTVPDPGNPVRNTATSSSSATTSTKMPSVPSSSSQTGQQPPQLHTATSLPSTASSPQSSTATGSNEDISRTCSPIGAQRMFGNIHVRVVAVTQKDTYTERKLILKMDDEERRVTHFWFIGWSDHSSPGTTIESARGLLQLVHDSESCRYGNNGNASLPSTPAPFLLPNPSPPSRTHSRSLSRQEAEEWSDEDFDRRFKDDSNVASTVPNVFDLSDAATASLCFAASKPGLRGYRASYPAPAFADCAVSSSAAGPIVVHCSAGVGRTGCFIALSIGCEQLCKEGRVDVLGIVSRLRLDRGGMVENSEQYAFLHAALYIFHALRNGREPATLPALANLRNQFAGPLK